MVWEENTFQLIAVNRKEPSVYHGCGLDQVENSLENWLSFSQAIENPAWRRSEQKPCGQMKKRKEEEYSRGLVLAGDPAIQSPEAKGGPKT